MRSNQKVSALRLKLKQRCLMVCVNYYQLLHKFRIQSIFYMF